MIMRTATRWGTKMHTAHTSGHDHSTTTVDATSLRPARHGVPNYSRQMALKEARRSRPREAPRQPRPRSRLRRPGRPCHQLPRRRRDRLDSGWWTATASKHFQPSQTNDVRAQPTVGQLKGRARGFIAYGHSIPTC